MDGSRPRYNHITICQGAQWCRRRSIHVCRFRGRSVIHFFKRVGCDATRPHVGHLTKRIRERGLTNVLMDRFVGGGEQVVFKVRILKCGMKKIEVRTEVCAAYRIEWVDI